MRSVVFWACLFLAAVSTSAFVHNRIPVAVSSSCLHMGLYDKPLPPRPSPRDDGEKPPEDDFLGENDDEFTRLFDMLPDGTEARGLIPPLSRTLKSGIGCYFEPTDRKVQNLAANADCHLEDAAWALEACKGDVTEAWTCISTARRMLLNQGVALPDSEVVEETDWDAELFQLMAGNEDVIRPVDKEDYENRKAEAAEKRADEESKRNTRDMFKGGEADERWLPSENPRPVDDEPWFTG